MKIIAVMAVLLSLLCVFSCANNMAVQEIDVPVVFYDINLVPMTSETVLEHQTVVIQGNRIVAVGPIATVDIPGNARVLAGNGSYLMPGLADMHIHTYDNWNTWPVSPLKLYLANGVTTIRCLGPRGGDQKHALRWQEKIDKGELAGPYIYACGPILYGPVDDPQKRVLEQAKAGFDFVKLYSFLSPKDFQTAMAAARQAGMHTAGHLPMQIGLDGTLSGGLAEIAHIEELAWEIFYFDRKKNIKGRKWMSYVAKMAYRQYTQLYKDLDTAALNEKIGDTLSEIAAKVKAADVPICTTLYIDEVIIDKLYKPDAFIDKPEGSAFTSDAEFDAITKYFQAPAEDEGFHIIRYQR